MVKDAFMYNIFLYFYRKNMLIFTVCKNCADDSEMRFYSLFIKIGRSVLQCICYDLSETDIF